MPCCRPSRGSALLRGPGTSLTSLAAARSANRRVVLQSANVRGHTVLAWARWAALHFANRSRPAQKGCARGRQSRKTAGEMPARASLHDLARADLAGARGPHHARDRTVNSRTVVVRNGPFKRARGPSLLTAEGSLCAPERPPPATTTRSGVCARMLALVGLLRCASARSGGRLASKDAVRARPLPSAPWPGRSPLTRECLQVRFADAAPAMLR